MSEKQIVKKQHFIPAVYLKRFSQNGYLNVLDLEDKKLLKPKHYNQICYKEFFYAQKTGIPDEVSQQLEDYLKSVEDNINTFMDDFVNKILQDQHIGESMLWDMAYLMSFMWIRTEAFRANMNASMSEFAKKIIKLDVDNVVNAGSENISKEEKQEMKKYFLEGEYDVSFDNSFHLEFFEEVKTFARFFALKTWRAYIANGKNSFIISDIPVVETLPYGDNFYGRHVALRNQYFVLSPKVLIELIPPNQGKRLKRKRINDNEVFKYNLIRADSSKDYCYSGKKDELELLVKMRVQAFNNYIKKLIHNVNKKTS